MSPQEELLARMVQSGKPVLPVNKLEETKIEPKAPTFAELFEKELAKLG